MEPRFSLPPDTPLSSKTEVVIGGVRTYVYGLEELECSIGDNIAVLYLAHNRTRTYKVTEGVAHEVLHLYKRDARRKKAQLIAVTINMRNHGDREISPQANRTWADGNETHGLDLLSMIEGSAQDFKLIMDFIPAYLPRCARIYNIMGGISLGGHTAWRIASLAPGRFHGFAMVVGSPNLTSLLLSRLDIQTGLSNVDELEYNQLYELMSPQQQRMWPHTLDKLVRDGDRMVSECFPTDVPILLCNGKYDTLVPAKYTEAWVARRKHPTNIRLFVQDNTGHSCTKEMVAMLAAWLGDMFHDQDGSARL